MPPHETLRRLAAEAFGTFCLVFCGTGAIVVDGVTEGGIGHAGIAAVFGLVVMAMIYAFGDVSGAHMNPAVTIGFVAAGRFPLRRAPGYAVAQLAGAIGASLLVRAIFPESEGLGATNPRGSVSGAAQAFALEVVLSFMLMLVILMVSSGAKEKGVMAGIAVGGVVGLEAMFGGPISGASMNPARSLGPALVSGRLETLWIYLSAPVAGALLAVGASWLLREPGARSGATPVPDR